MRFLLLLITFSFSSLAFDKLQLQKPNSVDPEFKKLSEALSATKALKADFSQSKKIKVLKRPLKSSGELIFDRSIGVYWKLKAPFESTVVIDNSKLTSIDDEGKKITIQAKEKPMLYGFTKIFLSIFSGNTDELKKHFEIYYGKQSDKWEIGLLPKSSELKKVLTKILLSGQKTTVSAIKLWESNGDLTDIHFSNIKISEKLTSADEKKFEL